MTDSNDEQFRKLEEAYADRLPKNWEEFTYSQKLEWFAHRMLLDMRGEMKHVEAKEETWLSDYQIERRRRREVQSKFGDWSEIPPKPGVFRRTYVNKNTVSKDELNGEAVSDDGQSS